MPEMALIAEGLGVARGGQQIIADLDLAVARGEAVEVRGPNGAGKSTLLLALAGLIGPNRGRTGLSGLDAETDARTLVHYLGHQTGLKSGLSVAENLAFWTDTLGGARAAIPAALKAAGLATIAHLDAAVLSAGQGRRLALARLMCIARPLWLLDEPTSALDAEGARWVGALISGHVAAGGMAVIATHLDLALDPGTPVRRLVLGASQ